MKRKYLFYRPPINYATEPNCTCKQLFISLSFRSQNCILCCVRRTNCLSSWKYCKVLPFVLALFSPQPFGKCLRWISVRIIQNSFDCFPWDTLTFPLSLNAFHVSKVCSRRKFSGPAIVFASLETCCITVNALFSQMSLYLQNLKKVLSPVLRHWALRGRPQKQ